MDSASLLLHGNGVVRLNHGRRFAFLHYVYRQISLLHVLPRNRHVSSKSIPEIPDVYESSHWKSVADGRFGDRIWKQIETSVAAFVDVTDDAARVWLSSFTEVVQRIRAKRKRIERMASAGGWVIIRPDGTWQFQCHGDDVHSEKRLRGVRSKEKEEEGKLARSL